MFSIDTTVSLHRLKLVDFHSKNKFILEEDEKKHHNALNMSWKLQLSFDVLFWGSSVATILGIVSERDLCFVQIFYLLSPQQLLYNNSINSQCIWLI